MAEAVTSGCSGYTRGDRERGLHSALGGGTSLPFAFSFAFYLNGAVYARVFPKPLLLRVVTVQAKRSAGEPSVALVKAWAGASGSPLASVSSPVN